MKMMPARPLYRNKKNGRLYEVHQELRDCTNSRDGTTVIAYAPAGHAEPAFVRDAAEFSVKFERIPDAAREAALAEMTRIAQETGQDEETSNPLDRSRCGA
ncbi:MAG: hypothetical protein RB191_02255 [Terriglobia bacterium]|nr:hypothetical protein [Terriglobia bacterium]